MAPEQILFFFHFFNTIFFAKFFIFRFHYNFAFPKNYFFIYIFAILRHLYFLIHRFSSCVFNGSRLDSFFLFVMFFLVIDFHSLSQCWKFSLKCLWIICGCLTLSGTFQLWFKRFIINWKVLWSVKKDDDLPWAMRSRVLINSIWQWTMRCDRWRFGLKHSSLGHWLDCRYSISIFGNFVSFESKQVFGTVGMNSFLSFPTK